MAPDQTSIEPDRYETLLEISRSILSHQDLEPLIRELADLLRQVFRFDFLSLILHEPEHDGMRLRILASEAPPEAHPSYSATPVADSPAGWVWQHQKPLILGDLDSEIRWPRVMEIVRANRIRSGCFLPLTTASRRLGALGFGFGDLRILSEGEIRFLESVAAQVAVAVDNAIGHDELQRERDRLQALLEINNALVTHRAERDLVRTVSSCLARVTPHDYASLALYREDTNDLTIRAIEFPKGSGLIYADAIIPASGSPAAIALERRETASFDAEWLAASPSKAAKLLVAEGIRSLVCLPLITRNRTLGTLNVGSFRDHAFSVQDVTFLAQVAGQIAIAVENALAFREITELKDKLAEEKLYLEDEIRTELNFSEIVGQSAKFRKILKQVETVAPTPATVLILGETGTGKELIARAIHDRSSRRDATFVKINCAAIPTGLLESELFGHEKGAFTGAIAQKAGRLELADGGTLFLDEVGDIPLELQPKLLRALQEHEFERLGTSKTIRVDIRLLAATNRDLTQMVADHQFRADLYYRLNVFPIQAPPLRERRDDIPLLIKHFTEKFARRMGRALENIPSETMDRLRRYDWPGNVRELENLIERAVILSPGPSLEVPELSPAESPLSGDGTMAGAERAHIIRVLKECNWVVAGREGAAARLAMKRTTLQSRMKKLAISRP